MFTGIVETQGLIKHIEKDQQNVHFTIESEMSKELRIDQSVAHEGVCLTVVACDEISYKVTAIYETLQKTNLGSWKVGREVNLERGMMLGARLDGHIVQGHVDQIGECLMIEEVGGSTYFTFGYSPEHGNVTIEKGSITVNGVSLTVVNSDVATFQVAIIPYTLENTTFRNLKVGDSVNLEFDVIGKYVSRLYKTKG